MRYREDILQTYGQLFDDAHAQFIKEAANPAEEYGIISELLAKLKGVRRASVAREMPEMLEAARLREADLADLQRLNADATAKWESEYDKLRSAHKSTAEQLAAYQKDPNALAKAQQAAAEAEGSAANAKKWMLPIAGAGAVGIPTAYFIGKSKGEEGKTTTRNLAFGAGAAAGLAAPHVYRGVKDTLGNAASRLRDNAIGMLPPDMEGY